MARSASSLRRNHTSEVGGEADMPQTAQPTHLTQMRHWPAHFAVVHKAALANDMLRYRFEPEDKVDEAAECGSAASHCEFK
jgi:hypothetical protein